LKNEGACIHVYINYILIIYIYILVRLIWIIKIICLHKMCVECYDDWCVCLVFIELSCYYANRFAVTLLLHIQHHIMWPTIQLQYMKILNHMQLLVCVNFLPAATYIAGLSMLHCCAF
jgi:hypothetical protein